MNRSILPFLNLLVRSINLASKFILIIFLAKLLNTTEFGLYGLLVASINLAVYFIGLDFYVYSNRLLLQSDKNKHSNIISSHFQLILVIYLITLPAISIAFVKKALPLEYIVLFYMILILDHLNQEAMRFLTVLGKPIKSNLLFFIRSGGWSFIVIGLVFFNFDADLKNVFQIWIGAEILCFILSLFGLHKENIRLTFTRMNWNWLKTGLKICIPFMIGTLAVRILYTGDRYIIEYFFNANTLAAYVLFSSLAAAILSFMDAAVFSFHYPELVREIHNRTKQHEKIIKKFITKTVLFLLFINICAVVCIKIFLTLIGKEIFFNHLNYFYFLLFIQTIYCLSMIPHYILYALNKDAHIIQSQVIALFIFTIFTFLFLHLIHDISAVFIGLTASFAFILFYKTLFSLKFIRHYEHTDSC